MGRKKMSWPIEEKNKTGKKRNPSVNLTSSIVSQRGEE